MITPVPTSEAVDSAATQPRHARLFDLIRQHNLAASASAHLAKAPAAEATDHAAPPQQTVKEFAQAARKSLLPQEQQALGINMSFGR